MKNNSDIFDDNNEINMKINAIYKKLIKKNKLKEPYNDDKNFGLLVGKVKTNTCEIIPKYIKNDSSQKSHN